MTQLTFRTSQCGRHGHPEFTLIFSKQLPVSGLERMLLGYFENGVARGSKFLPGQVVQLGWAALRLMKRQDGTIGVQEIEPRTESGWVESVDRSLMQIWFQKEVVASLGIAQPAFPRQLQNALVCNKLLDASEYLLSRGEPRDAEDSGWFLGCFDDDHDHDDVDNLSVAQLVGVTNRLPFVTQFLALPAGTNVHISGTGRIRATIFIDGEERTPAPGSYLAGLNSDHGR